MSQSCASYIISFVVFLALVGHVQADIQITMVENFYPKVTKQTIRTVTNELNSDNTKQIDQAVGQIKFWISSGGQTPIQLGQQWLPTLVSQQRYQDAADIALNASTAQPNIPKYFPCACLGASGAGSASGALALRTRCLDASGPAGI